MKACKACNGTNKVEKVKVNSGTAPPKRAVSVMVPCPKCSPQPKVDAAPAASQGCKNLGKSVPT
jgi:hypothetical protein